jgi:hypothetical protein
MARNIILSGITLGNTLLSVVVSRFEMLSDIMLCVPMLGVIMLISFAFLSGIMFRVAMLSEIMPKSFCCVASC